ncbi:DUF4405 domain-containing protein [Chloroflexota bacterium]
MKQSFKNHINYAMAVILLIVFSANAISSFVLWFVLPRGEGRHGQELSSYGVDLCSAWGYGWLGNYVWIFNWPRYIWVDVHAWISVATAVIILVHFILHWRWIIESTKRVTNYFRSGLKKITERYITGAILFVLLLFQIFSGCIHWFVLPRGARDFYYMVSDVGRTFLGLQRNEWSDLHGWIAVAMASIIIIHTILHWKWIVTMTRGKTEGSRRKVTGFNEYQADRSPSSPVGKSRQSYLTRVGKFIGLVGAISFLVFAALHQLNYSGGHLFMLFLIPLPFIMLFISSKRLLFGGILLSAFSLIVIPLNIYFAIGTSGYIPGLQLGYTIVFVSLPLMVSGVLFIISGRSLSIRQGFG